MGVRSSSEDNRVCLYDSTTGWALGPTFHSQDECYHFMDFLGMDARELDKGALEAAWNEFNRANQSDRRSGKPEATAVIPAVGTLPVKMCNRCGYVPGTAKQDIYESCPRCDGVWIQVPRIGEHYTDTKGIGPQDILDQCVEVLTREDKPSNPDILTLYIMVKAMVEHQEYLDERIVALSKQWMNELNNRINTLSDMVHRLEDALGKWIERTAKLETIIVTSNIVELPDTWIQFQNRLTEVEIAVKAIN